MEFSAEYQRLYKLILNVAERPDGAAEVAAALLTVAVEVDAANLAPAETKYLRFMCSSALLNCGFDLQDVTLLERGRELAELALAETGANEPLHFQCLYNIANAIVAECDRELPAISDRNVRVAKIIENRIVHRMHLREARNLFFGAASSRSADPRTRSSSYCNLANSLVRQPNIVVID